MTTQKKKNTSKAITLSSREAPEERKQVVTDFLMPLFNDAQMRLLVNKTPDYAIQKREGAGGRMLSYVKHGYVTDQLNKAFGFDWDLILEPMANGQMYALQIEETPRIDAKTNKPLPSLITRHLAVCGHLTVRVHDSKGNVKGTITKSGFGSQIWQSKMEFGDALKGAKSDLLKVCAAQVGVALDLYWNDMAEVEKYEDEQEKKRLEIEQHLRMEKELAEAGLTLEFAEEKQKDGSSIFHGAFDDRNASYPPNGVALLSRASSELQMNGEAVAEKLGMTIAEVINTYKPEYWDTLKGGNNANSTKTKGKK